MRYSHAYLGLGLRTKKKKKETFYFVFGSKRREGKEVNINNDMSKGIVLFVV